MKNLGYGAELKLKQKKDLALVFEKGKWKTSGNLRIIVVKPLENAGPKVGVSVSKRYFKKAVDRNRIKRLLRESYRHNRKAFHDQFGENCLAMVFWNSKDFPTHFIDVQREFQELCQPK